MKVIEELKSIRLQLATLAVIFVSSMAISLADHNIAIFNDAISELLLSASNDLQRSTALNINMAVSYINQFLPLEMLTPENRQQIIDSHTAYLDSQLLKDPKIVNLVSRLRNSELELKPFYGELTKYLNEVVGKILNDYNTKISVINYNRTVGTPWTTIKMVLYILQILAMLILARKYYTLIVDMSNRITSTEKTKSKTTSH
jgi:hypothetical protein